MSETNLGSEAVALAEQSESIRKPGKVISLLGAAALTLGLASPVKSADAPYTKYNCGNTTSRVLLTYDDWNYNNPKGAINLAYRLKKRGIGAYFFPVQAYNWAYQREYNINIVQEIRKRGQYVGNHTNSHANLTQLSADQVRRQIKNGVDSSLLRPPYGARNETVRSIAKDLGYKLCMWTADTSNWRGRTAGQICDSVVSNARRGSVVLMHLQTNAPQALNCIINGVRDKGLEFCEPWQDDEGKVATSPKEPPNILPCKGN